MLRAPDFDAVIIGGDLLELGSTLEADVQIVVVEKYLARFCQRTRLLVSSGNHDGDARSAANESICRWLREMKAGQLFVDGDSVEIGDALITICPWWDGRFRARVEVCWRGMRPSRRALDLDSSLAARPIAGELGGKLRRG
jgi:DNA repair exonuclease SbcCD nuclease subunit